MKRRTMIISAITSGVVVLGTAGIAVAATGGDDDAPITGDALERATAAALDHTGGGTVTDTELDDEDSYYEVEVTLDDGSQVDVQLDEDFTVVGSEADRHDGPDDDDSDDDDSDDDGPDDDDSDDDGPDDDGPDDDGPITGDALERATAAALDHTGGGAVTDTELDDEDGRYEVEVTRDDGTRVDVHLDESFAVVSVDDDTDEDEDD
jgi:uncharacterized membrane protein YkoI